MKTLVKILILSLCFLGFHIYAEGEIKVQTIPRFSAQNNTESPLLVQLAVQKDKMAWSAIGSPQVISSKGVVEFDSMNAVEWNECAQAKECQVGVVAVDAETLAAGVGGASEGSSLIEGGRKPMEFIIAKKVSGHHLFSIGAKDLDKTK